jgi:hypothetical protein
MRRIRKLSVEPVFDVNASQALEPVVHCGEIVHPEGSAVPQAISSEGSQSG